MTTGFWRFTVRTVVLVSAALLAACARPGLDASIRAAQEALDAGDIRTAQIHAQNALQADAESLQARELIGRIALQRGDLGQARFFLEAARAGNALSDPGILALAAVYAQMNDATAALELLDSVSADYRSAEYWLTRARALGMLGRQAEAADSIAAAAESAGESAPVVLARARLAVASGNLSLAVQLLDAAADRDDASPEVFLTRGEVAFFAGRLEDAARDFSTAETLYRSRAQPQLAAPVVLNLVRTQLALGRVTAASESASRLAELASGTPLSDFALGLVAYQRRDFAEAVRLLRQSVNAVPDQPQFLMLLGTALMAVGNNAQAEQQFLTVLEQDPTNAAALRLLAESRLRQGRSQAALDALARVDAEQRARDIEIMSLQAAAFLQGDRPADAAAALERALGIDPTNQLIAVQLARTYVTLGREADADELLQRMPGFGASSRYMTYLTELLEQMRGGDPDAGAAYIDGVLAEGAADPEAQLIAAVFQRLNRDNAAAISHAGEALRLDPELIPAHLLLAALLAEEGRAEEAEEQLIAVTTIEPTNLAALMGRAQLAVERNQFDAAEAFLRTAAAGSAAAAPRTALARLYLALGDIDRAADEASLAAELEPGSPEVATTRGLVALAQRDFEAAVGLLQQARDSLPNRADVALMLARAQTARGNQTAARDTLAAALQGVPASVELRAALGAAEMALGNEAAALGLAREIQSAAPQRAAGFALEGEIHAFRERYEQAANAFRLAYDKEATLPNLARLSGALNAASGSAAAIAVVAQRVAAAPADSGARLLLAQLQQAAGSLDEALTSYEAVIRADSDSVVALNNAAWLAWETGRPVAVEYARRASELAPESAAVLDTLGWVLVQSGDVAEGLEVLTTADRIAPQAPDIRYHLSFALARTGREQEAREVLRGLLDGTAAFGSRPAAEELLRSLQTQ